MRDDVYWVRYDPEKDKVEKLDKVMARDVKSMVSDAR